MRRRSVVSLALAVAVVAVLASAHPSHAQSRNPMVGRWALDVAKSSGSGAMPRSRDLTISQAGSDITVVVNEISADGAALEWQFTTRGDGKPVPVTGWTAIDSATSTLDGNTGKTVYMKDGKQVLETNTEVSPDGKVLRIKGTRLDASGKPYPYTGHYDRK